MIQLNEISPYGYGIFLYSPDVLTGFLKSEKCRAKKLCTYFNKNKDIFFKAIENGIALPIYQITVNKYAIFVSINEVNEKLPKGWEQVYKYEDFFIQVGSSNKLCWASFDHFEYSEELIHKRPTRCMQIIPHGPTEVMLPVHEAIDVEIPQGYYSFNLIAYRRIEPLDETMEENRSRNYAYGFIFKYTDTTKNENLIKCDNEKTIFDIKRYSNV